MTMTTLQMLSQQAEVAALSLIRALDFKVDQPVQGLPIKDLVISMVLIKLYLRSRQGLSKVSCIFKAITSSQTTSERSAAVCD